MIVDGEPNADDPGKVAAGLDPRLECFPKPLRFGRALADGSVDWTLRTEPIAADVRPGGRCEQGYTDSAAYRAALEDGDKHSSAECRRLAKEYATRLALARLKILSGLLGVPLGTLTKRDAAHRAAKFRRLATVFGLLLLLAFAASAVAFWQSHGKEIQRGLAVTQSQIATTQKGLAEAAAATAEQQRLRAERESAKRQGLLEEAARSDMLAAEENRTAGDERAALAHLERALRYVPSSSHPAEAALPIILSARWEFSTTVLAGHTGEVETAVFSPDGRRILTASSDRTARIWDAQTGAVLTQMRGHKAPVLSAVFSPDGRRVLTASEDATARLWDALSGKLLVEFKGHKFLVRHAVFSPDGRRS